MHPMPAFLQDIRVAFRALTPTTSSFNGTKHSHKVKRGRLRGSSKTWICKEMRSPLEAHIEVLAQEFFRLIIPHQNQTRHLHDPALKTHFILSEEVSGYRELPENQPDNFSNGTFQGLGQILFLSMFLQEIDFKNGNIGLDNQNRVIKIDGDWCFAEERCKEIEIEKRKAFGKALTEPCKFDITADNIASLPLPKGFYSYNWLDLVLQGTKHPKSNIINPFTLMHSEQFRAEVNQAILKICLLPNAFTALFVDNYIEAGGQKYIDLLKRRRSALIAAAYQLPSFATYLHSAQAEQDMQQLQNHLATFKVNDNKLVLPAQRQSQINSMITENFKHLKSTLQINSDNAVLNKTKLLQLLSKIEATKASPHDVEMTKFVDNAKEAIQLAKTEKALAFLQAKLQSTLSLLDGNRELLAVKNKIDHFRTNACWYSIGMNKKAVRIEQALCSIPVEQRSHLISGPQNAVQEALASHRYFNQPYTNHIGLINKKVAANAYKELNSAFFTQPASSEQSSSAITVLTK